MEGLGTLILVAIILLSIFGTGSGDTWMGGAGSADPMG
jgi:hypothetical protein